MTKSHKGQGSVAEVRSQSVHDGNEARPASSAPRNIEPAFNTAMEVCKRWLSIADGSFECGMKRIGTERFDNWVLQVEEALEKINPKEDPF